MTNAPTRARSNAEDLATALRDRIIGGQYAPGQQLVEMDIADDFEAGRSRVREAFRLLVGEGYLVFIANRGVFVRVYSRDEILEMGRAREVLEGLAARLAAERPLSDESRERLISLQDQMDKDERNRDFEAFGRGNIAYHALIERLAGNAHVSQFISRVRLPLLRHQLPSSFLAESMARSNRDHRTITAAILNAAPEAAEAAMRAHVQQGNAHIATLPDSAFPHR